MAVVTELGLGNSMHVTACEISNGLPAVRSYAVREHVIGFDGHLQSTTHTGKKIFLNSGIRRLNPRYITEKKYLKVITATQRQTPHRSDDFIYYYVFLNNENPSL